MQVLIGGIRKLVVVVLLMELVLQMQQGKQYEPFVRILTGIIVVYTVVSWFFGIGSAADIQAWSSDWYEAFLRQSQAVAEKDEFVQQNTQTQNTQIQIPSISEIYIDKIEPISVQK